MTPDSRIKLVSELLDLPLYDTDGLYCGVVDDVELEGKPGKDLKLTALLVGPGAYVGRMPSWAMVLVRLVAGERVTRVPMDQVSSIGPAIHLKCPSRNYGLHRSEDRARAWIPHTGAL
jgi:sporulation protein YlmC with PRC-barrel domain